MLQLWHSKDKNTLVKLIKLAKSTQLSKPLRTFVANLKPGKGQPYILSCLK